MTYIRAVVILVAAVGIAGCGLNNYPAEVPVTTTQILTSPEIATGAWTIYDPNAGSNPIGGFYGALTASQTSVHGAFTVAAPMTAPCAPNVGETPVKMVGTASNGSLILDSTFLGNRLHLIAQLSADRRSFTSGSYSITGSCALSATNVVGYQTAPLTGTYTGTSLTTAGVTKQITATIVQGGFYYGAGYIPITGTVLFTGSNCSATMRLNGSLLIGDQSFFEGYTVAPPLNDALMFGTDDSQNSQFSGFIDIAPWGYTNPACGSESQDTSSNTTLIRN